MAHVRNGCSLSSRFLPQARRIVGSGDENGQTVELCSATIAFRWFSYIVTSLLTNIPLSETIDSAVNAIFESNTGLDLKLSKTELKELFNFATSHTHFLFNGCFYD